MLDRLSCPLSTDSLSFDCAKPGTAEYPLSLAAGIDVVTVSHYLGHANPNVTLSKYSHFMPKDSVNPATVLANLLEEKS